MTVKIAIVNDIHAGESFSKNGHMRAASQLVQARLPQTLKRISEEHEPDLLVNMGDLIRKGYLGSETELYRQIIQHFSTCPCPVIHMLGNHELVNNREEDIKEIWKEEGYTQNSFGEEVINNVRVLWLGMEAIDAQGCIFKLSDEQLQWLDETLKKDDRPAILLTHFAIDDQDVTGNFFYTGQNRHVFFFENQEECRRVIAPHKHLKAVIQAHLHYFNCRMLESRPYVTLPAMIDNICAPYQDNIYPEVYSVLELTKQSLKIRSYSKDVRFAGVEIPLS